MRIVGLGALSRNAWWIGCANITAALLFLAVAELAGTTNALAEQSASCEEVTCGENEACCAGSCIDISTSCCCNDTIVECTTE